MKSNSNSLPSKNKIFKGYCINGTCGGDIRVSLDLCLAQCEKCKKVYTVEWMKPTKTPKVKNEDNIKNKKRST
jgi:hypothetical protein